ncbi:MAG: hypothetical protein V4558_00005 [Gemmatimonadota bacterium]
MSSRVVRPTLLLAFLATPLLAQAPAATSDLPVRSVVLFSSGVGYFEHGGTVRGSGSAELRFKTAQINDVLKSLTLQDLDGGKVTTITYPSQDPVSKTLRSFQVDITNNPGMGALLNQLRGARVTIQTGAQQITGTVVGVEQRRKAAEQGGPIDVPVLNVLSGAMIRSIELPSISSLTLDDAKLQDELTRALAALSQARDQDKKPVTISYAGEGARRLRVGYVVETPIWKTSYRLILEEKRTLLQGWAIVENQTESDWNNVSLSLVSGRPISFKMDLYQPLYLERPTVVPEYFAGLRPQVYEPGSATDKLPVNQIGGVLALQPGKLVPRDKLGTNSFEDASLTTGASSSEFGGAQGGVIAIRDAANSVRSSATGAQLGELFQYAIRDVTLARQKSAMLPIVTDSVSAERVSIYNSAVMPRNPLYGVRLKNTTGMHLLQGPVTVIEAGSYAGDARLDNVPPGQQRLLSYGIDLDLVVDNTTASSQTNVVTAKIVKGVLTLDRKSVASRDYKIDNKGTREKVVIIEHPARQGWTFVDGVKPVETTPAVARFQTTAPAGKVTVVAVREERIDQQTVAMVDEDIADLLVYNRTGAMPPAVRDAIAKAIEMRQAIAVAERQIDDQTAQIAAITQEQTRIRENMKTVDAKSQYYGRLLDKLNEQETLIERAQKERDSLTSKKEAQEKTLADYLNGLTIG